MLADFLGTSVAGVGDINADGYDDFLMGASANDAGQAYLILGMAIRLAPGSPPWPS